MKNKKRIRDYSLFQETCLKMYGDGYSVKQIVRKLNSKYADVWDAIHKYPNEEEEEDEE